MTEIIISNKLQIPFINDDVDEFIYNSLTITNPKYIENQRMNRWSGNTDKQLFFYQAQFDTLFTPRGFLSDLSEFFKNNNIEVQISDNTTTLKNINYEFKGNLKPFQTDAINAILKNNIGVLQAPTGSGKTVMGLYTIFKRKQPTLIIVHTKELLDQWKERIKTFLSYSEDEIGIVGAGEKSIKEITVALVQTLKNHKNILDNFGLLVVDECHRCPSSTFIDIISAFKGRYILGLSATPYRNDGLGKLIEWYLGKVQFKISEREMVEKKHITKIKPIIKYTNFKTSLRSPKDEYSKLLKEMSEDEERNQMIIGDVLQQADNDEVCLILTDRKNHCDKLSFLIPKKYKAAILTGDTSRVDRKEIVDGVNNGGIKILIATGQLIGEGFDCKNLSSLFLSMPVKYSGRVIQYVGRVLRPKDGKEFAYIYDYFDPSVICLYGGFKSRQKVYEKYL